MSLSSKQLVGSILILASLGAVGYGTYRRFSSTGINPEHYSFKVAAKQHNIIPILIIGSGCAGYSSAIYAARSSIKTVLFAGHLPGGQLSTTSNVDNWPGLYGQMGPAIIEKVKKQAEHFGAEVVQGAIKSIDASHWPFEVMTDDGVPLHALSIIIATGANPRLLGVPGEKEYWGKGVTTCAICDAPFHKDCDVVVVGGGDSAAEEAIQLSGHAKSVTVLVRKDEMRASQPMQKRLADIPSISIAYNHEMTKIAGNDHEVTAVELYNNKTKETTTKKVTGVFLAIGHEPNSALVKGQVALDDQGYIKVIGRSQHTTVPGIFAAGDIEDHVYRQAGVAAGSGIKAALDAATFLTDELGFNERVAQKLEKNYFEPAALTAPALKEIDTLTQLTSMLSDKRIVLLDFYTQACPSCLQMMPTIQMLAHKYKEHVVVAKINAEKAVDIAKKYAVQSVPTIIALKGGEVIRTIKKALPKGQLESLFKDFV